MQKFICSISGFRYSLRDIESTSNTPIYAPYPLVEYPLSTLKQVLKTPQNSSHSALLCLALARRIPCITFRAGNYALANFTSYRTAYTLLEIALLTEGKSHINADGFLLSPETFSSLPFYAIDLLATIKENSLRTSALSDRQLDEIIATPIELDSELAFAKSVATQHGLVKAASNAATYLLEHCNDFHETLYTRLTEIICNNKRYSLDALSELHEYLDARLPAHTRKQELEKYALLDSLSARKKKAPTQETRAQKEQSAKEINALFDANYTIEEKQEPKEKPATDNENLSKIRARFKASIRNN